KFRNAELRFTFGGRGLSIPFRRASTKGSGPPSVPFRPRFRYAGPPSRPSSRPPTGFIMVRKSTPAAKPDAAADRGSLTSLRELMAILDCFSPFDRSLPRNEISARCGMPKTPVHRLVTGLREVKLLEQDR